jgi:hypothetical protein
VGFSLSGAWDLPERTRLGMVARLGTASALRGQPELRVVSASELALQGSWAPSERLPVELGIELGLSHRRYSEDERQVATAWIPTAGLLLAAEWSAPVVPTVGLRPWALLATDLRAVRIREEGDDGELAARTALIAGLELCWRAPRSRTGAAPSTEEP